MRRGAPPSCVVRVRSAAGVMTRLTFLLVLAYQSTILWATTSTTTATKTNPAQVRTQVESASQTRFGGAAVK